MPRSTQFLLAALVMTLAIVGAGRALAGDIEAGDLVIGQPWARATPAGAEVAGGYLTILNRGSRPDRLLGGSLEVATGFAIHDMTQHGGVMTMRPTGPLDIPAGDTLTLAPGGKHIMLTGLKHGLAKGQELAGTLLFEHAGTVPVHFEVEAIGATHPAGSPGRSGASMPGMKMN